MYEAFFSLTRKPFDLLPNPEFLFLSKSHKKAITYLDYAICERAGFILLTGEIGSGKTTIIRDLIKKHHESIVLAKIFNTMVSSEQLIAMINDDFGIAGSGDKTVLLRDLNEFLIEQYGKGNKPVLIIDEAQNLAPETLEEIRMLSNLETDSAKLLQIILVGQPELRKTLALPELLQLRQRISFYCHIKPLTQEEVEQYILHRLEIAGNRDAVLFLPGVVTLIWQYSRGIPRLINIFCDFLLLAAYADGVREISAALVHEIVGDLDFVNQFWGDVNEIKSLPPVGPVEHTADIGAVADRELLTEISHRLDVLEKREASSAVAGLAELSARLELYGQTVQDYMQTTAQDIDALKRALLSIKSADISVPSPPEGERKKGLLEKLFRAV